MATPHDLYLRFLATKGFDDFDAQVKPHLEELELKGTAFEDFKKQIDIVDDHLPEDLQSQIESKEYGEDFLNWMKILEVDRMWLTEKTFQDPTVKRLHTFIIGMVDDPHLRISLNALLIRNVEPQEIVQSLNGRFAAMLDERHIDLYKTFFFDPRRMTRSSWRKYLKTCTGKEKHIYFIALSDTTEALKAELELPSQINTSEVMQFLLHKSLQKAKIYLEMSNPESNREARAWIDQTIKLTDKYEKFKTGDKNDFSKVLTMEFDFISEEFPTPDQETLQALKNDLEAKEKEETSPPTSN